MTAITQTPRITLTPIAVADAREMAGVLADESLYTFTGGAAESEEALVIRYARWVKGSANAEQRWLNLVVRLRENNHAIGYVQATVNPEVAEIAWVIGKDWQGHGYAAEAAAALVDHIRAFGVRRVVAFIVPHHRASQRVAEKLGMVLTDETKDGEDAWALRL